MRKRRKLYEDEYGDEYEGSGDTGYSITSGSFTEMDEKEISDFVALVREGGKNLPFKAGRAVGQVKGFSILYKDGEPIGCMAVKAGTNKQVAFRRAGIEDLESQYDVEIGYFYIKKEEANVRFSLNEVKNYPIYHLVDSLASYCEGKSICLVLREYEVRNNRRILTEMGFKKLGNSFSSSTYSGNMEVWGREAR